MTTLKELPSPARLHLLGWGEDLPQIWREPIEPCRICGVAAGELHHILTLGEKETRAIVNGEATILLQAEQVAPAEPDPCFYCGTDENEQPYPDTEAHRDTSQHQLTVYNS